MSLNIAALVGGAFATARELIPDAFPAVTLQLGPTTTVNPITDTRVTTWAATAANLRPVAYSDENERESQPVEGNQRSHAFPTAEIPAGPLDQGAEIVDGGLRWHVYRVEKDPTSNLVIFHCRR